MLTFAGDVIAATGSMFDDNADSVAIVIGNKTYRQTVSVVFAQNDADATKEYLVRFLGFRDSQVIMVKDVRCRN